MKFAVLVKATKKSEDGTHPAPEMLAAMGKFNEELVRDEILLAAEGFRASSFGARLRFHDQGVAITEGPFESSEGLVSGFWLVKGSSKKEIIERFRHAPMPMGEELEIRQVFEAEDFGENLTPEVRAQEARLRASLS